MDEILFQHLHGFDVCFNVGRTCFNLWKFVAPAGRNAIDLKSSHIENVIASHRIVESNSIDSGH